ncbi:Ankyrin-1 [Trichoderma lentiforme]|uniref:Ankyrin-1 n=2 Tax=Trichoderma lentiforme TaxID=1567552 RepID=A0A9P4XCL1_9HYPO|nr:Ankyrin-1 [Trichoderma lentiforme]
MSSTTNRDAEGPKDSSSANWLDRGTPAEISGDSNKRPLHFACANGLYDIAKILLENGANPMAVTDDGLSSLHLTAASGNFQLVEMLMNTVYDLDISDYKGRRPIHLAAKGGHEAIMSEFLFMGANSESSANDKTTLLHYACEGGSDVAVKELLESGMGGSVFAKNDHEQTPLHIASKTGHHNIVAMLIRAKAECSAVDKDGNTPLDLANNDAVIHELLGVTLESLDQKTIMELTQRAVRYGYHKVLEILLEKTEVDLTFLDDRQMSLLDLAAENGHSTIIEQLLASYNFRPEQNENNKRTPISYAAENGHNAIIEMLINKEWGVNISDVDGRSPISFAAEQGHESTIELLLEFNADVDKAAEDGATPLWYAAKKGHSKIFNLLLRHGANPNVVGILGRTCLHVAARYGYIEIAKALLNCETFNTGDNQDEDSATAMYTAAAYGQAEIVTEMLGKGLDKEKQGPDNHRPLHAAHNSLSAIRALLRSKPDLDAKTASDETALAMALRGRNEDVVEELLENGANPFLSDAKGDTSLHIAARDGAIRPLRLILQQLEKGFNINSMNNNQETAISLAVDTGNLGAVQLISEQDNVDVLTKDSSNHTTLWKAVKKGDVDILKIILKSAQKISNFQIGDAEESAQDLLSHPLERDNVKIFELLWKFTNLNNSLEDYCTKRATEGHSWLAKLLLDKGANSEGVDIHGWTLSWIASLGLSEDEKKLREDEYSHLPTSDLKSPSAWSDVDNEADIHFVDSGDATARLHVRYQPDDGSSDTEIRSRFSRIQERRRRRLYDRRKSGVRANHPMLPHKLSYFEITIINQAQSDLSGSKIIAVGFGRKNCQLNNLPGLYSLTWGYHSDDGEVYGLGDRLHGSRQFGAGDTIGCGVNLRSGTAFFTKNGARQGIKEVVYPVVVFKGATEIKANFTGEAEPFIYDLNLEKNKG